MKKLCVIINLFLLCLTCIRAVPLKAPQIIQYGSQALPLVVRSPDILKKSYYDPKTFFLAGSSAFPWRAELIKKLSGTAAILYDPINFALHQQDREARVQWEITALATADVLVFWFPKGHIAPTSLLELGRMLSDNKPLIIGVHPEYEKRVELINQLKLLKPNVKVLDTLDDLVAEIIKQAKQKKLDTSIVSPNTKEARTPKRFVPLDTSFLDQDESEASLSQYKKTVNGRNPEYGEERIWTHLSWDINLFNRKNKPVVIGSINDKKAFSGWHQGKGMRFLDLPIYMPGQGWKIPEELSQFKEVIAMAVRHERVLNPEFERDHYVYITVDQGIVQPYTSQRRSGYHSDSYRKINSDKTKANILVDNVYVVADACPTVFAPGPYDFSKVNPSDISAVLNLFDRNAEQSKNKITYPSYTVLRMDPYCVHTAGYNTTDKPVYRTFVKISVSRTQYRKLGNAHNFLFKYDWPMIPRHGVPYAKSALADSAHIKERDSYMLVVPGTLDFTAPEVLVPWAERNVLSVMNTSLVRAKPAKAGVVLETKNDNGQVITVNVSAKDDWQIWASDNDTFFVTADKFKTLYKPHPQKTGWFQHAGLVRRAIRLTKDIRIKGPWGTLQYGRAGDMLVYISKDDTYIVPKSLFDKNYKILAAQN